MAQSKVLVADKLSEDGIKLLKGEPGLKVDVKTGLSSGELAQIIGPCICSVHSEVHVPGIHCPAVCRIRKSTRQYDLPSSDPE